jgi:monoamine oxidase
MSKNNKKIHIIGAGIAGLAAANKLMAHGFDVTLLEAQNRVGGRIKTDYSLGFPVDIGAGWLHGITNNPIANLAKKNNIAYMPSDFSNILFYDKNKTIIPTEKINAYYEEEKLLLEAAHQYANHLSNDISLIDALAATKPTDRNENWQQLWQWTQVRYQLYMGVSTNYLSARHWDDEEVLEGGNQFVTGGYDAIIQSLTKDLNIQLNTIVTSIYHENENIKIITNKGEIKTDAVIVTLPLSLLQNNTLEFIPKLPANKINAISRLGMGVLNRVALQFKKVFWPNNYSGIYIAPQNNDPNISFFIDLNYYLKKPILVGAIAGANARAIELLSDQQTVDLALESLRAIFGSSIPQPEKYLITRWNQDPFARGSYSFIPINSSSEDYDTLALPIDNKIFFAGEATHRQYPATTHGAYLSGIREAQKIIQLYN